MIDLASKRVLVRGEPGKTSSTTAARKNREEQQLRPGRRGGRTPSKNLREIFFLIAEEAKPDTQLFQLLSDLLQQVESMSNQEEVELRAKIEALGLEATKVPERTPKHLDELETAAELDKLSMRLDSVDKMISSAMASDPEMKSLLSSTAAFVPKFGLN